jgi:hypothetical protein
VPLNRSASSIDDAACGEERRDFHGLGVKFHDAEPCETCLIPPVCEDSRAERIELNLNSGGQCLLLSIRFSTGFTYNAGRLTGEKQELVPMRRDGAGSGYISTAQKQICTCQKRPFVTGRWAIDSSSLRLLKIPGF